MRQFLIFLFFALLVILPFLLWGDALMERFALQGSINWLSDYGKWAWIAGIFLLISDILLPVPGTLIMSALGYIYGPWLGSLIAIVGSVLSGALGYWLCRSLGKRAAHRILGASGYDKGRETFNRVGGWLVVLSRWLPIFPEVVACMAGLNHMDVKKFHLALLVSALPMGIVYAIIGHAGTSHPTLAIILSACLPPIIWLTVQPIFNRQRKNASNVSS